MENNKICNDCTWYWTCFHTTYEVCHCEFISNSSKVKDYCDYFSPRYTPASDKELSYREVEEYEKEWN